MTRDEFVTLETNNFQAPDLNGVSTGIRTPVTPVKGQIGAERSFPAITESHLEEAIFGFPFEKPHNPIKHPRSHKFLLIPDTTRDEFVTTRLVKGSA